MHSGDATISKPKLRSYPPAWRKSCFIPTVLGERPSSSVMNYKAILPWTFREDLERELNEYDEYPHSAAEEAMFIDDLREREIYIQ